MIDLSSFKDYMADPSVLKEEHIKDFNDSMTPHTHACSDLSFIYYVNPPDKSTITFYSENNPNCYSGGIFDTKPDPTRSFVGELNYINSGISSVMVNRGDLLVFPSNLKHGVAGTGDASPHSAPYSDRQHGVSGAAALDGNAGGTYSDTAASGALSGDDVWRLQPVLDNHSAAAGGA